MTCSRIYVQRCDYLLVERGVCVNSNPVVYIASVYMHYTNPEVWPEDFERLVKHCTRRKKKVIISADSNAHSSFWGSADTNNRGLMLEDFILRNNLAVMNTGSCPTFYNSRGHETVIDVTLCSPELEDSITEWKVNLDFQGLDHHLIKFALFADDAGLITTGSDPTTLVVNMQTAVDRALQWGRNNELMFSTAKTVAVLFTRKWKWKYECLLL